MNHVHEVLPDWLLGGLDAVAAAEVSAHIVACPTCAQEATDLQELFGLLALSLPSTAADPKIRARLMEGAAHGRLDHLAGAVAALFGVDEPTARAALDAADAPEGWEPSSMPGVLQRLWPGAPAGHLMGFIKIPRGGSVPWHEHLGSEQTLVLQGRLVDNDGVVYAPGDQMPKVRGSRHTFVADGPLGLLCGVIIEGGYTLLE